MKILAKSTIRPPPPIWSILWTFSEKWSIFGIYCAEKSSLKFYLPSLGQTTNHYSVSLNRSSSYKDDYLLKIAYFIQKIINWSIFGQ